MEFKVIGVLNKSLSWWKLIKSDLSLLDLIITTVWLHGFRNGALVPTVCPGNYYYLRKSARKKKKVREFPDFLARVTGVETGG